MRIVWMLIALSSLLYGKEMTMEIRDGEGCVMHMQEAPMGPMLKSMRDDCVVRVVFDVALLYQKMRVDRFYYAKQMDVSNVGSASDDETYAANMDEPGMEDVTKFGIFGNRGQEDIVPLPPQRGLKAIMGDVDPREGFKIGMGISGKGGWVAYLSYMQQTNSGRGGVETPSVNDQSNRLGLFTQITNRSYPKIFTPTDIYIDKLTNAHVHANYEVDYRPINIVGERTGTDAGVEALTRYNYGEILLPVPDINPLTDSLTPDPNAEQRKDAAVLCNFYRPVMFFDNSDYIFDIDVHQFMLSILRPTYICRTMTFEPHCGLTFLWDSIVREVIFYGGSIMEVHSAYDVLRREAGMDPVFDLWLTADTKAVENDQELVLYHDRTDDYFGGGLEVGLNLSFCPSRNCFIFCDQSLSLLYGHHDLYDGLLWGPSRVEARSTRDFIELSRRVPGLSPVLQTSIGIGCKRGFMRGIELSSKLALNLFHGWNQFYQLDLSYQYHKASNKIQVGIDDGGSLSMAGLLFNVGVSL